MATRKRDSLYVKEQSIEAVNELRNNPYKLRKSQRVPQACIHCSKKRIKCDKQIPCENCIKKNIADSCSREPVIVRNVAHNISQDALFIERDNLLKENRKLNHEVERLQNGLDSTDTLVSQPMTKRNSMVDLYHEEISMITRNDRFTRTEVGFDKLLNKEDSNLNLKLLSWDYNRNKCIDFLKSDFINKENVLKISEFALRNLSFKYCAVIPLQFLNEVQECSMSELKDFENWDLFNLDKLLWNSILFATLTSGLIFSSSDLRLDLHISEEEANDSTSLLFMISLKCLEMGRYMEFPNLKSIQAFLSMNVCFHNFAGITLQNVLLSAMICIASNLGIDKLTLDDKDIDDPMYDYLQKKIWLTLVMMDTLETYGRVPLIATENIALPLNYDDDELYNHINKPHENHIITDILYQLKYYEIVKLEREIFIGSYSKPITLNKSRLEFGIEQTKLLHKKLSQDFEVSEKFFTFKSKYHHYLVSLGYKKLLLDQYLNKMMLELNRKMYSFVDEEAWISVYRLECLHYARELVNYLILPTIPNHQKKFWVFAQLATVGAVFILADMMMYKDLQDNDLIEVVELIIPQLEKLKATNKPALKGVAIIKHLLSLVKKNKQIYPVDLEYFFNDDEFDDIFSWFSTNNSS